MFVKLTLNLWHQIQRFLSRLSTWVVLATAPMLVSSAAAQAPDPLPNGAIARLGALRFRHLAPIRTVAYSFDGKYIATGCEDGTIHVWDSQQGTEITRTNMRSSRQVLSGAPAWLVPALTFTPDDKTIVAGDRRGVWVWRWKSEKDPNLRFASEISKVLGPPGIPSAVESVTASPNGRWLGWVDQFGTVRVWDLTADKEAILVRRPGAPFRTLCADSPIDRESARIAFSLDDNSIRIWDLAARKETLRLTGHRSQIAKLCSSPVDAILASSTHDGQLFLWDTTTGKCLREFALGHMVTAMTFSPDGKTLAIADGRGTGGTVMLYTVPQGKRRLKMQARMPTGLKCLAFSPNGKVLAGAGEVEGLRRWDTATGAELETGEGHLGRVTCLAWSREGSLASSGVDRCVWIWSGDLCKRTTRIETQHSRFLYGLQFSPDGKLLATAAHDPVVSIVSTAERRAVCAFRGDRAALSAAGFCEDGKVVVACGFDGKMRFWDLETRRLRVEVAIGRFMGGFACAPDDQEICVASYETVQFWDCARRKLLRSGAAENGYRVIRYSEDGGMVAALGDDGGITVFETASAAAIARYLWNLREARCTSLAFVGDRLVCGYRDGTIVFRDIWDPGYQKAFLSQSGSVESLEWNPTLRLLASAHGNTTILLWKLGNGVRNPRKAGKVSASQIAQNWALLRSPDAVGAFRAAAVLIQGGADTVRFVKKTYRAVPEPDEDHLTKLIKRLGDDDYHVREGAMRELARLGNGAAPALKRSLKATRSAEIRRRMESLLEEMDKPSADELRALRAIRVLESIGGDEAIALLERIGSGAAGSRLTRMAKAALRQVRLNGEGG